MIPQEWSWISPRCVQFLRLFPVKWACWLIPKVPACFDILWFCDLQLFCDFWGYSELNLYACSLCLMILPVDLWLAWAGLHMRPRLSMSRASGTDSSSPTPPGPDPASALTSVGFKLNIGPGGRMWVLVQINYDSNPSRLISRNFFLWSSLFYQVFSEDSVPPLSSFSWHYQSVTVVDTSKATWLSIDPGRVLYMVGGQ